MLVTPPGAGKIGLALFAICFTSGALLRLLSGEGFVDSFVFGGSEGVWLLFFPALFATALAAGVLERKEFRKRFGELLLVSLAGALLASLAMLAGVFLSHGLNAEVANFALLGNALAVLVWFVALLIVFNARFLKALPLAFVQAFLNIAFVYVWARAGLYAPSAMAMGASPVLAGVKLMGAAGVMLFAFWALSYVLNAPAKKNYGVSMVAATALFFAQWLRGNKGLEEVAADLGEEARVFIGTVIFRSRKSHKLKAFFVTPLIHFGPFGNLGGSEFPALLTRGLEKRFGGTAFVFHGTVNHDFNPAYSSSVQVVERAVANAVNSATEYSHEATLLSGRKGLSSLHGYSFGGKAFLLASRAPASTEDFDAATGTALRYKILARGFGEVVLGDAHNSLTDGAMFDIASREYFEYEGAVDALRERGGGKLRVGVACDGLKGFSKAQGVGDAGLRAAVIEAGGKRSCLVVFDGNNMAPGFRERLLSEMRGYGFDYCDVATTDTHSVNTVNGAHNPLGARGNQDALAKAVYACVERALANVEDCEAAVEGTYAELTVFGAKRQSELLTMINSVVSVAGIIAPVVLAAAALAAFALLAMA
ncbi:MAG: DUF2070 family protein [Candidatus Micrarchaeia archaeon]